jgi:hypothetical protein
MTFSLSDKQTLAALRWLFYAFAIDCSYFAIRGWFWWGWRDGIEGGATVSLFLIVAMALEFLLCRAVIVILALLAVTAFLSAWLLLGNLATRFWGDALMAFLWLAGSIFGFIHSRRLSKSMRKKQIQDKGRLARPLPQC